MRIWKTTRSDTVLVIADEGKAFKTEEGTFFKKMYLPTEEDANSLTEVYYHNGYEVSEEEHIRFTLLHELKEIREWFASTDYIPNKVIVGEWSTDDPRFIAYCEKRKQVRARQDEVKELLGYGGIV